ncbi:hypothetical protein Tco_1127217, partial [Tanacetum coccineum]
LGNEGDDLGLAFALGVGTPWRHRSLILGICARPDPSDPFGYGARPVYTRTKEKKGQVLTADEHDCLVKTDDEGE